MEFVEYVAARLFRRTGATQTANDYPSIFMVEPVLYIYLYIYHNAPGSDQNRFRPQLWQSGRVLRSSHAQLELGLEYRHPWPSFSLIYITAIPHRVSTAITQTNGEAHVAVGSKSSPFFLSWPTPRRSSRRTGPSFEFLELYMSTVYTCRQLQSGRHYIYYYLSSNHQTMRRQSGPPSIGRVLFSPYP
jgi:hypothetical protein